jgi:plastocyanin
MTRLAALISSLALAGGALAGCGGGDDNGGGGGGGYGGSGGKAKPATTATASTTSPAGTSSEPVQISLKDIQYHPRNVAVHEGQKVRWTNDDTVAHTVTGRTGADFDSGTMKPNIKSFYETTMRNAGKVTYFCKFHPNMTGTITIVPA